MCLTSEYSERHVPHPHRLCRVLHDFAWHGDIWECVSYIIAELAANCLSGSQKLSQEPGNRLFCVAHHHCDSLYPPWNAPWPDAVCINSNNGSNHSNASALQLDGHRSAAVMVSSRTDPQLHLRPLIPTASYQDHRGGISGGRRNDVKY